MCYRFVITFENDHVRGMYLYGTDVIGVLLDKEVYVVKFDDKDFKNLTEIAHIPLLKIFVYDNYNGLVLEFKLINETCAILCVTEKCCVTTLRPNLSANHFCFSLSEALKSVSAALADNAVILRLVNEADVASLDYVIPYDEKLEDPSRQSFDAPRLTDFVTVAAFSTSTHSYFVGSAKGLDLESTKTCVVRVTGSLNSTDSTIVNVTLSKQLQYTNKAMNNKWKMVTSITALLGMLVLICITCFCFSRHYDMDLKKTHSQNFNQLPLDTLYISMEDQLNPKDLVVLNTQPLGSGISATVYKGSYKTVTGDYMPVAVKILNNEYALLVNTAEFISELEVLRQVEHSNLHRGPYIKRICWENRTDPDPL